MERRNSPKATSLWICPICGRRFAKTKQAHSCKAQSVVNHFSGKDPRLKAIFESLIRKLKRTGPLRVDAVNGLYLICGVAIVACIAWAGFNSLLGGPIYWPESIALIAFALSWLVKGYALNTIVGTARSLLDRNSEASRAVAR